MAAIFGLTIGALTFTADAYPVSYSSCGVDHSVSKSPERIVTMNQGATEFMLALGLADKMVGTAYLDDYIWPQYATAYAKIPVLAKSYPNETTIMSVNPDFLVASYNSAFRQVYDDKGKQKGIFSNATVTAACAGTGSEWTGAKTTCRPQLNAQGVGTFLFSDHCEDTTLRPRKVTEDTVYAEMRTLGRIFKVDAEALITDMKKDFDAAAAMVSSSSHGSKLKAVWLDCVGRCCKTEPGQPKQVFVGGGSGAPGMLMNEAGMVNAFAHEDKGWACVNVSDVIKAAPDVMVVIDADWDKALDKLTWLYNQSELCAMDALKGARLVQVPFSASTLSPRNGPAALDLAIASLHVRTGSLTAVRKSGVSSFNPQQFREHTKNLMCNLEKEKVKYDIITDGTETAAATGSSTGGSSSSATSTTGTGTEVASGSPRIGYAFLSWVLASLLTLSSC
jgi:iron complex transport system substrate-binding protein